MRVALVFVVAAIACRPEPSHSTAPAGDGPAPQAGPTIPVGSAVAIPAGATVWLDAARTQPIELPARMPGGGVAMIVVTDHGATLEVDTATNVACASPVLGDFALRLFVQKSDLRSIARTPFDHAFSAALQVKVAAGAPVEGANADHWVEAYVDGKTTKVPIAAKDVALHVAPPLASGECVSVLENGKPPRLDIADPSLTAALADPSLTYTGTIHHAKKGAKVWWRDGSLAGTVAVGHTFRAPAVAAGQRSCLPLALAPDNTTTLCFETKDLTEGTAGQGTIGLGNVGLIGKGGGSELGPAFGDGKSIPRVRQAKATVTGALDKDIVRRIVRAHINEIRHCYNQALIRDPAAKGRITIDATIDETGAVVTATPQPSDIGDLELPGCMAKAFMRWKFPKPTDGAHVTVSYPFILEPA